LSNLPFTHDDVIDVVDRKLATSRKKIHTQMKRGLIGLATIAATAPFVGLFGTTQGIMSAFKGCDGQKEACMAATTSGISEALLTTALGLLVAVPAAFAYNYFSTRMEFMDTETELTSQALVAALTSRVNRLKQG
jgi:biopolymer transport protein ExbB